MKVHQKITPVGYEPDWVKLDEAHDTIKQQKRHLEMKDAILREVHALLDNAETYAVEHGDINMTISLISKAKVMLEAELGIK